MKKIFRLVFVFALVLAFITCKPTVDSDTPETTEKTVANPEFNSKEGAVDFSLPIAVTSATKDATIHYSINDNSLDNILKEGNTIDISTYASPLTISAKATKEGCIDSSVVEVTYTKMTQVATPNITFGFVKEMRAVEGGIETTESGTPKIISQELILTCETDGAKIYYTDDDRPFSTAWNEYKKGDSVITKASTIRAVAIRDGYGNSDEAQKELPLSIMPMVHVEGGDTVVGSRDRYGGEYSTRREVYLSDFMIGTYTVTQGQWFNVMGGWHPSVINLPAHRVSWFDALRFCNALSKKEGLEPVYYVGETYSSDSIDVLDIYFDDNQVKMDMSKNGYRLPTEAEWEYAARSRQNTLLVNVVWAGTNDKDKLHEYAWFSEGSIRHSGFQEVGKKKPNELMLYDMSGNIFEFCWDMYYESPFYTERNNPTGPANVPITNARVLRGGFFGRIADHARVDYRTAIGNSIRGLDGIRVVRRVSE